MISKAMTMTVATMTVTLATAASACDKQVWLCSVASAVAVDEDGTVWSVFGHALREGEQPKGNEPPAKPAQGEER